MPTPDKTLLCRYHYDPLDRLAACTPSTQARTQRFYLKERLTSEIQGSVQRSIFQQDDQLLAQQQRQDGVIETTLLATDQQRSVLHALDAMQPRPLAYTPYGHRPAENGLLSLLGFNGERPDPVTGHYLLGNGYRAFNPVLMRFNSPDNLSPFGEGGLNAYAYSVGDPVNRKDPTGHYNSFVNTYSTSRSSWLGIFTKQRKWQPQPAASLPDRTINGIDQVVRDSLDHYNPTPKRLITSADNAIHHAKLIGHRSEKIETLKTTKEKFNSYITDRSKTIEKIKETLSYDSISGSDGPTVFFIASNHYEQQRVQLYLQTAQETYELNSELAVNLGIRSSAVRKT
ncbi:RHS repeat-associated core domain-containing protein [Pseudomonas kilonensis]|uniref:RHS repeat-associated core domain-containing protein n=1 Tax=Pseudomonas kilonensis TaxID=132476 RepID=A0ABY0YSH7_9PSED|nr:RHS repeat-associated core domain-containing protein [Pseudomonas kilonensis]SED93448.1 RHS repeat-associated core domain-containing protein [Pseudomonas kilonensis]